MYVELPLEDPLSASGRYVGKLERAMYGTRHAPMIWQDREIEGICHSPQGCFNMRHDTFFSAYTWMICCAKGVRDDLLWLKLQLLKEYEVDTKLMGDDDDDMENTAVYLGRTLEWSEDGLGVQPKWKRVGVCPRH